VKSTHQRELDDCASIEKHEFPYYFEY